MAGEDKKVSTWDKMPVGDKASLLIALASLFVSLSALWVSWTVWRKPPPPDPTIIPTFGQSGKPATIDGGDGGRKFFAFLDRYPGRKVRIIAIIGFEQVNSKQVIVQEQRGVSTYFYIPRNCPGEEDCLMDALDMRGTGRDKPGLEYSSGDWILEGYFANHGLVTQKQSTAERALTAIDIVTAVS